VENRDKRIINIFSNKLGYRNIFNFLLKINTLFGGKSNKSKKLEAQSLKLKEEMYPN